MKLGKKYKLTDETIEFEGRTLYRIQALREIVFEDKYGDVIVREGDKGGFVQSEENLSQEGDCWLFPDTAINDGIYETIPLVYGSAKVFAGARVYGSSKICGNVQISDYAIIKNSEISGEVQVFGEAKVIDSTIEDNVKIYERCTVCKSQIYKNAQVFDKARVYDSIITDNAKVYYNAYIFDSFIDGESKINSNSRGIKKNK